MELLIFGLTKKLPVNVLVLNHKLLKVAKKTNIVIQPISAPDAALTCEAFSDFLLNSHLV